MQKLYCSPAEQETISRSIESLLDDKKHNQFKIQSRGSRAIYVYSIHQFYKTKNKQSPKTSTTSLIKLEDEREREREQATAR